MTPYLSEPMVIRLEGMINPKVVRYSIIIEIDIFCQDLHEVSRVEGIEKKQREARYRREKMVAV